MEGTPAPQELESHVRKIAAAMVTHYVLCETGR